MSSMTRPTSQEELRTPGIQTGTLPLPARDEQMSDAAYAELLLQKGLELAREWRYQEAIAVFSVALSFQPFHPLLYRYRGHRYISVRQFQEAIVDLTLACRLDPTNWDSWYHLGLAYYLAGEFGHAEQAYRRCLELTRDESALVAISDWYWMTLMRLGKKGQADGLLEKIHPDMVVGENVSYHNRLLMYKGLLAPELLLDKEAMDDRDLGLATSGYGLGHYYLLQGDKESARRVFQQVVQGSYWPAFGYIAAEAELTRIDI